MSTRVRVVSLADGRFFVQEVKAQPRRWGKSWREVVVRECQQPTVDLAHDVADQWFKELRQPK